MRLFAVITNFIAKTTKKDPEDIFTTDPFEYFNLNEIATDVKTQALAASFYRMLHSVALGTIVISAIIGVVRWGITPPGKRQSGIVEIVGWKLIIVMLIAAFVEIVGLVWVLIDRIAAAM